MVRSAPLPTRSEARGGPRNGFEQARERLHVSAVPDSLPCRENEFADVLNHLQSALLEATGACIYISGVPGTGKTATVREAIRTLHAMAEEKDVPPFQFVEINGMKLTEPAQAYIQLWEAISGQRVTAAHAVDLLARHFSTPGRRRRRSCVVLMDELDLLVTKKQDIMYNFFEWPSRPHAHLVVLAVANTMDLPERVLSNKVSSRLGLTRICFPTYDFEQLNKIVSSRLRGISVFDPEAVMFCARKVSAVSGDARRALDICRRAVEIVEAEARDMERDGSGDDGRETPRVTMTIITRVCNEMYDSPNVDFVIKAGLHQKLFLYSTLLALRRSGTGEAEFGKVAAHHRETCRLQNIEPLTTSDLSYICAGLGASRCLLVESGRLDMYQRIRLNIREEDIKMALKKDPLFNRLGL